MTQAYFDRTREDDPHALPNLEIFYAEEGEWGYDDNGERCEADDAAECMLNAEGYYWWACFPGCLPDSEPNGPFESEEEALNDAREGYDD